MASSRAWARGRGRAGFGLGLSPDRDTAAWRWARQPGRLGPPRLVRARWKVRTMRVFSFRPTRTVWGGRFEGLRGWAGKRLQGPDRSGGHLVSDRAVSTSLPLVTIDRLVDLLDIPAEPWSVQLEVRVAGSLDECRLRQAISVALGTHERWQARAVGRGQWWRHPRWELTAGVEHDPLDVVACTGEVDLASTRAELHSQARVLEASPPLRLRLARHPDGDVLMLNLHHAAGDGFSAVQFLRSVARSYAGAHILETAAELPSDATAVYAPRGLSGYRRWLGELARELAKMVRPAGSVAREGASAREGYGLHHLVLSAQETAALVKHRSAGATVNDLLLAALHLAIAGWNAEHGQRVGRISVHMPVNLRPARWRQVGVGNFSFPVTVATRPHDRGSPASALAAVTRRTGQAKASGSAHALLPVLGWLLRLPPGLLAPLASWLAASPAVPTAVLSNLGRLEEPLWLEPDATEVWFSPPIKMPAGLALGVLSAGGRLHVSFRYRHAQFGPEAAGRFAERYLAALRSLSTLGRDLPFPSRTPAAAA